MEIKSLSAIIIFIVAMTIFGPSVIGVGEMAGNQDDKDSGWIKKLMKNNDWHKKFLDLFNIKKLIGFMNSEKSSTEDFNSEGFSSESVNSPSWICGNGKVDTDPQSDEECEPPNTATCDAFCHFKPFCGDGIINQASEQCEPPNTATCDASCKIRPPRHAYIDMELDSVLVDPNKDVIGDEYFDNLITECSFHSAESIEGKVCLTCKIVDTKVEPCEDLFLSFTQFPHGTILGNTEGFPNAVIPGVTITAVANTHSGGGKNAAIIFDGDTPGDNDESPTPDPDLRADGNQADENNLDGRCPNCAGKHIVIIAENTAGGSDGIVNSPDDNAQGGTQTWVFDEPWFVNSFDFVDYDNTERNGEARAYNNPQCSGTPVATAVIKASPNGGDGSVQTIFLNANNVRCLQFEYKDSGGVTNVDLECIKKLDDSGVLSEGTLVLPDGYVKSTSLSIPLEHGVDVQKAVGVKIDLRCPGGCTPGFWKQEHHFDSWVGFEPSDLVGSVFDQATTATSSKTLLEALSFMGGPDLVGAEKILLRAAVAGILSASNPEVGYPSTAGDIITSVNAAIASADRDTMLDLAAQIDADNNLGCPLNGGNTPETIFSTGFEDTTEKSNWKFDSSRSGVTSTGPQKLEILTSDSGDPANAHTGTKYLGGSGDFDPQFAAYNRSIDVSAYHSVQISLWYSNEDTETDDDYALYYKDGSNWIPIKEVPSSELNSSSGQTSWKNVITSIPDSVDTLVIQFRWSTSSTSEHMMLDDIEITGIQN
ncbi:MAG: hypothetical protein ACT4NJ_05325 [Nitrosopumilaceae archaeon]